jgi:hypothetical protein
MNWLNMPRIGEKNVENHYLTFLSLSMESKLNEVLILIYEIPTTATSI